MKVAILILAHKNMKQVRRLVDQLKPDFEVYLHVDKRIKHALADEDHVHVLKTRHSAYWGSDGAIKAMLELLRQAHKDQCDYYMFISGQDLPLMGNQKIKEQVASGEKSYVQYAPLPKAGWDHNGGLDRIRLYWDTKYESNNPRWKFLVMPLKVSGLLLRKLQLLTGLKRKLNFKAFGGSIWLNLTAQAASYIIDFTEKNPSYLERFRYTRASDEIFFQSILMGFDYPAKDKIINDDRRYADWTSGPNYPRTLTMEDLDKCLNSGKLFGRKFDERTDEEVMDKIRKATAGQR